jgi:hypothetical protein
MRRIGFTTFCALLLAVALNTEAVSQDASYQTAKATANQQRADLLEKVKRAPSVLNSFENASDTPLIILNSNSKEISKDDYHGLIGLTSTSDTLVSFPDVTLVNNSNKAINSFILLLTNRKSKSMPFLKASGVNIQPNSTYIVSASRWVRWDKQSNRAPDLDSEKMWLLGSATDLTVRVAQVVFTDNSKWVMEDGQPQTGIQVSRAAFTNVSFYTSAFTMTRRRVAFSCVCSCGVTCHRDGSWTCSGDGGDCTRYQEAINCINTCCANAANSEGCGRYGGIL